MIASEAKPRLFLLSTEDEDDQSQMTNLEGTVLRDERVATAAKFFECHKINGDKLNDEHKYFQALKGRTLPRIVVMTSEGEKLGSIEGKVSPTKLYGLMKASAERAFKVRMDRLVKEHRSLLNRIDKLDGQKRVLASKEERAEGRETSSIRKLRRSIEAEELKIQKMEEKLFDVDAREVAAS